MATYQYECPTDGETVIITRPMADPEGQYSCESCGGLLRRVYDAPPVKFNAKGFYSTGG